MINEVGSFTPEKKVDLLNQDSAKIDNHNINNLEMGNSMLADAVIFSPNPKNSISKQNNSICQSTIKKTKEKCSTVKKSEITCSK